MPSCCDGPPVNHVGNKLSCSKAGDRNGESGRQRGGWKSVTANGETSVKAFGVGFNCHRRTEIRHVLINTSVELFVEELFNCPFSIHSWAARVTRFIHPDLISA